MASPNPSLAQADTPTTWEATFALLHQLWGDSKDGAYDKRAWARFAERLYHVAESEGYVRGTTVPSLPLIHDAAVTPLPRLPDLPVEGRPG